MGDGERREIFYARFVDWLVYWMDDGRSHEFLRAHRPPLCTFTARLESNLCIAIMMSMLLFFLFIFFLYVLLYLLGALTQFLFSYVAKFGLSVYKPDLFSPWLSSRSFDLHVSCWSSTRERVFAKLMLQDTLYCKRTFMWWP